jgi:heme-degrading monooxygenase HmoA
MEPLARTPPPPYYAVVFSSVRTPGDAAGYAAMAEQMARLAAGQPGFLGLESARGADGFGITVSYWDSPEAIERWRQHTEHRLAQGLGRDRWYAAFRLRVCKVEQERAFGPDAAAEPS